MSRYYQVYFNPKKWDPTTFYVPVPVRKIRKYLITTKPVSCVWIFRYFRYASNSLCLSQTSCEQICPLWLDPDTKYRAAALWSPMRWGISSALVKAIPISSAKRKDMLGGSAKPLVSTLKWSQMVWFWMILDGAPILRKPWLTFWCWKGVLMKSIRCEHADAASPIPPFLIWMLLQCLIFPHIIFIKKNLKAYATYVYIYIHTLYTLKT